MEAEPENVAAMNLITVTIELETMAVRTAFLELCDILSFPSMLLLSTEYVLFSFLSF